MATVSDNKNEQCCGNCKFYLDQLDWGFNCMYPVPIFAEIKQEYMIKFLDPNEGNDCPAFVKRTVTDSDVISREDVRALVEKIKSCIRPERFKDTHVAAGE